MLLALIRYATYRMRLVDDIADTIYRWYALIIVDHVYMHYWYQHYDSSPYIVRIQTLANGPRSRCDTYIYKSQDKDLPAICLRTARRQLTIQSNQTDRDKNRHTLLCDIHFIDKLGPHIPDFDLIR